MTKKPSLRERLKAGPVLVAEGYLFELERRGYVKAGPYVPEVVLDYPDAVRELHREFLRAGSDVMVAFTYYGHRSKLRAVSREGDLEELNKRALRIAREIAEEGDALMAGNLSNTWEYNPDDKTGSEKKVRPIFEEQVEWAREEDADFIIAETFSHLGEAEIALRAVREGGMDAVVTLIPTCDSSYDGHSWEDSCRLLHDQGALVVGLNCGRGPETVKGFLVSIRRAVTGYVAALPVPYRTTREQPYFQDLKNDDNTRAFPTALDGHTLTRFDMADFTRWAVKEGINYIGVCCGGAPHHVRSMAEALGRVVPASRYSQDLTLHPVLGKNSTYCDSF
jgi:betaine-homocysteine S-methyltransferase